MGRNPKILVVDDEPDILDALVATLRQRIPGAVILGASNGREALGLMRLSHVDLVLTDFYMPGMDGGRLLLESRKEQPHIKGVLMTAYPETEMLMEATNRARVERIFTKPLDAEELGQQIQRILT